MVLMLRLRVSDKLIFSLKQRNYSVEQCGSPGDNGALISAPGTHFNVINVTYKRTPTDAERVTVLPSS